MRLVCAGILTVIVTATACSGRTAPRTPSSSAQAACDAIVAQHGQPDGVFTSPSFEAQLTMRPGDTEHLLLVAAGSFGGWNAATVDRPGVVTLRDQAGGFPADCKYAATLVAVASGTAHLSATTYVPPGSERAARFWTITVTVQR